MTILSIFALIGVAFLFTIILFLLGVDRWIYEQMKKDRV